jgi:hypothetical protein
MMKVGRNSNAPVWRLASATDIQAITGVAEVVHPTFSERREVFAEKLSLFPSGCFVLVWHGEVVGYGLSHPWMLNSIPALDSFLGTTPGVAACLYIHADGSEPLTNRQSDRSASASGRPEHVAQVKTRKTVPPDRPAEDPSSIQISTH